MRELRTDPSADLAAPAARSTPSLASTPDPSSHPTGTVLRAPPPALVLDHLTRHAWNATAFQNLEPGLSLWLDPVETEPSGVMFFDTGAAWVAAGAPLASTAALGEVGTRFVAAARREGRRACFFATERRFSAHGHFYSTVIGEQPVWDPHLWPESLAGSRSLRQQLTRARHKGVQIRELTPAELMSARWRTNLASLAATWLDSRALAPMGFLVQVDLFSAPAERRTFVALRQTPAGHELVACLAAVPIHQRAGWLFEDILRRPSTPNGTTELLIDAAMRTAAASGAHYVTLGLAPLSGPVPPWLAFVRRELRSLYDFQGVRDFRAKLGPRRWDPIELTTLPRTSSPRARTLATLVALYDSLTAFARGDLVAFGLRTFLRHPRLVAAVLFAGLLPWMALLALLDWRALFPSPTLRAAWLGFDTLMSLALLSLSLRFRPRLARAAAIGAGLDATLGSLELAVMCLRAEPPKSALVAMLSVATPLLARALLRATVRRGAAFRR